MKYRKLMFVLPNLFTVSSIFCGFYAISLCTGDVTPKSLYQAALAIFFGVFFDGFDGRVARLTKTQSEFGAELDSLADVISFGAAPGLLVYKWALSTLGVLGLFLSFAFVTCGALRLARFNVLARRPSHHGGSSKFFVGLPIPLAGGTLAALVMYNNGVDQTAAHVPIAVVTGLLSGLMVSNVRYRTFKGVKLSRKSASVFLVLCFAGVVVATQTRASFVLMAYLCGYIVMGLAEEIIFFRRRRAESSAPAAAVPAGGPVATQPPVSTDDVDDDEDDDGDDVDEEDYM